MCCLCPQGASTPYYYKADGIMEAYIRIGNESVIAPSYVLNQLILKGMHRTYDELISEYDFKDYAFSKLRERYKAWTGNSMEEKLFDSFDMRDENGKLTNAALCLRMILPSDIPACSAHVGTALIKAAAWWMRLTARSIPAV